MSDCRNGGRVTYAVPKPVEQATVKRMCREFGEPPWTYPVDKPECWPDEAAELVGAIEFGGVRYERVRECGVIHDIEPRDTVMRVIGSCSECGHILCGSDWCCPHCGARVRGGGE